MCVCVCVNNVHQRSINKTHGTSTPPAHTMAISASRNIFHLTLLLLLLLWIFTTTILPTNAVVADTTSSKGDGKVVLLTRDNYDELTTQSKTAVVVFIKFFAPWCGHCKKIKADWQKLAEEYNNNNNNNGDNSGAGGILVAEVDCTDVANGGGKALCRRFKIESFPTLKYGDPTDLDLEDYNGKQSYEEISAFAREQLVPMLCSPTSLELCVDDTARAAMIEYAGWSVETLTASILFAEQQLKAADHYFKTNTNRLTKGYEDAKETKRRASIREQIRPGGDSLLKRQTIMMLKKKQNQRKLQQLLEADERNEHKNNEL